MKKNKKAILVDEKRSPGESIHHINGEGHLIFKFSVAFYTLAKAFAFVKAVLPFGASATVRECADEDWDDKDPSGNFYNDREYMVDVEVYIDTPQKHIRFWKRVGRFVDTIVVGAIAYFTWLH